MREGAGRVRGFGSYRARWSSDAPLLSSQFQVAAAVFFCGFSCAPSGLCLLHGTALLRSSACAHTHPSAHAWVRARTHTHAADAQSKNVPVEEDVFNCVSPDVMSHFLPGSNHVAVSRYSVLLITVILNKPPSIIDLYIDDVTELTEAAAGTIQHFSHIFISDRSSRWIYVIRK